MVHAVGARTQGDDYQARVFWLNACRLLMPNSKVVRVVYENPDTLYFDDVAVYYDCDVAIERGEYCKSDHFQVKFHVDHSGRFTYQSLTDPAFIGAKKMSLLQRVHDFIGSHSDSCRLYIVAPWGIEDGDPLNKLVSCTGGEIRLRQLFSDDAAMRKVKEHWAGHLNLNDTESFVRSVRPIRMEISYFTLESLQSQLNAKLQCAGLVTLDESHHHNPYDDLIRKWQQSGRTSFTREELIGLCKKEGLWAGPKQEESRRIGIRSFVRWAEHMEDDTALLLSLDDLFDEREINDPNSWNDAIPPKLEEFVEMLERGVSYELRLDTHSSVAFAAGRCLNPKRGIEIGTIQRVLGREVLWKPGLNTATAQPDTVWKIESKILHEDSKDVALVLNVSQDATADVITFVQKHPEIRRVLILSVLPAIGSTAVKDGNHCLQLAQAVSTILKQRSGPEREGVLHIFAAVPNGFMFLLGQLSQGFGKTALYEYNFDSN
ncbi:MAG TPA: SAVED domain-containing protein, partial [Nitrospira sp.]|nr:SAVED domain-containing protein [Nitrospira sp.]